MKVSIIEKEDSLNIHALLNPSKIGIVLLIIVIFFGLIPFTMIKFVPSTDLPQHLSQIRLLYDYYSSSQHTNYVVSFFSGNVLVYWILSGLWLIFTPLAVGNIFMIFLVTSWILSIFLIAWKTEHSFASATLASTLTFNASMYWGFINFLIGFPIFVLWYIFIISTSNREQKKKQIIGIFILSFILFYAHALWLVIAIIALMIFDIRRKVSWKLILYHTIGILPVILMAIVWFPEIAATRTSLRFDTAPHWVISPLERLQPKWIVNSIYGGIRNPIEWILVIGIIVWIILSIYTNRKELKKNINWDLLYLAFMLLCIVYFAPEKYVNTIYFASRWYPIAMIFILISLPSPKIPLVHQVSFSLLFFIMFSVVTTIVWKMFETYENSGLNEALEAVPQKSNVLGLDLTKQSTLLHGRPFMQTFAYANVLKGAKINFSFALHQSGIVKTTDTIPTQKWTLGLEWFGEWVSFEDFNYFDYTLINAPETLHNMLMLHSAFTPITINGNWRLYECKKNNGFKGKLFRKNN